MAKEKVEFGESDFKNSDAKSRYGNEFEKKVCIAQRLVDVKSLECDGVKCFQWIKQMGLQNFLELDEPVRDHYTRLFYANIEPQANETKLMIYVNGEEHKLTSELLNKILRIPNEGAIIHPHRGNLGVGCYSPKKWCMELSGNRVEHKVPAASLNKSRKVLHYYVCQMVYPKAGTIDKVSNFEAFLLWAIENNYKLNLGHIIIEKIVCDRNKSESRLPYGTVISKIYKYFGETFSKEAGKNVSQIMNAPWVKTLSFSDESIEDTEKDEKAKRKKDISPDTYSTDKHATGYLKKMKVEPSVEKKGTVKGIKIEDTTESKKQADKKNFNGVSKKFKGKTKLEPSLKEREEEMTKEAVKGSRKETTGTGSSSQRSNQNSAPRRSNKLGAEGGNDQPKNGAPEMKKQAVAEEATKHLPKLEEKDHTKEATQQHPTLEEQDRSPIDGSSPKGSPPDLKQETSSKEKKSNADISNFDYGLNSAIFEGGESSGLNMGPPIAIIEGKVSQPAPPDDISWKPYYGATWDDPAVVESFVPMSFEPLDENIEQYFAGVEPNGEQAQPPNADLEQKINVVQQDVAEVKEQLAAALSSFQTEFRNLNERLEALPSLIAAQIRDVLIPPIL